MSLLCLCMSFFMAQISGRLCQTVLTQPNLVSVMPKETAKISCNIGQGKYNKAVGFYKQSVGGVPQHVLKHYHHWSSPSYGPNFSSDQHAILCVFGQGTKLTIAAQGLPVPSLTLLRPSKEELANGKAMVVCLANQISKGFAEVSWTTNGSPVTTGVVTSPASVQDDGTFSLSSFLSVSAADWDSDRSYCCTVSQGGSASASRQVKKSNCTAE
ncbi:immunoglobulin lambda-like polypeptide 1 [Amia ocellicauda]|uniref:immunoglobulin lambda-like polypeptide 1 n=1 Tax=Amia ocellicauda TaxID=2972642 RepID=UPI003464BED1